MTLRLRYVELDGYGTFEMPPYLSRINQTGNQGWFARPPGKPSKWFADGMHGDPIKSFTAAQKFLIECDAPAVTQRIRTKENKGKLHPTGVCGVFLHFSTRKHRKVTEARLVVPRPDKDGSVRTFYLGNEHNYMDRLPGKIGAAEAVREKFVREWQEKQERLLLQGGAQVPRKKLNPAP